MGTHMVLRGGAGPHPSFITPLPLDAHLLLLDDHLLFLDARLLKHYFWMLTCTRYCAEAQARGVQGGGSAPGKAPHLDRVGI